MAALCIRIAFAYRRVDSNADLIAEFTQFYESTKVSAKVILEWLKGRQVLLLIDELNVLLTPSEVDIQVPQAGSRAVVQFLKDDFLTGRYRYFVFSSHIVSLLGTLSTYMDMVSSRKFIVRMLPLTPNLKTLVESFKNSRITPQMLVYYGLIPSMIWERYWILQ